jgi:hypothetical protein
MDAVLTITPPPRARSIGATVLTPEEAVDPAEALGDRRGVAGHARGPRHVGLDGEPHPAHPLDRGQRLAQTLARDVDQPEARALGGEAHRGRAADAAGRAGDQRDLALEAGAVEAGRGHEGLRSPRPP